MMQRRQPKQSSKPSGLSSPKASSLPLHSGSRRVNVNKKLQIHKKNAPKKNSTLVGLLAKFIIILFLCIAATGIFIAINRGGVNDVDVSVGGNESAQKHTVDTTNSGSRVSLGKPAKPEPMTADTGDGNAVEEEDSGEGEEENITDDGKIDSNADVRDNAKVNSPNDVQVSQGASKRTRTTAEANAYMSSQQSRSIDGEIALKKNLNQVYNLQKKGSKEDLSPIATRWLGEQDENGNEIKYWLPKSSTSDEAIKRWKIEINILKEKAIMRDIKDFPILHPGAANSGAYSNLAISKAKPQDKPSKYDNANQQEQIEYPSPAKTSTRPIIKPTFGSHRENVDAVFALAEGYDLKIYLLFIESLLQTGFDGDLVVSVSSLSELKPGVEEYLKSHSKTEDEKGLNVVAYTVTWTCYESDG
eukprot:CAMPEP_0194102344 /NCGR_PEP_ID=MMETSP0150-20130528/2965_1 /TAXON_ID=122233 /ORGANISM="Chaetoceros debilis, Strain MM31A-1" /LENGTH=415 /DNA_ID=CAMNT_0038789275 /DNA_START=136 /DNA_END=1380 /DNA_ORIENTATION=-